MHLRSALPLLIVSGLAAADGARELTSADDVRTRREATRDRQEEPKDEPEEQADSDSDESTDQRDRSDDAYGRQVEFQFTRPLPEGASVPSVVIEVEQGWYGMSISNGTEASAGGGSLGEDYEVGYEIDPFRMTRISGTGRIDRWGFSGSYSGDPADRAAGEAVGLGLLLFTPDDGGWWQATLSWARLRGTATTADAGGRPLTESVDSRWRTVAIERRTYPILLWGVQYEELRMPSAYSLDDPDGQVVAIFDDTTRWTTISVLLGIDSANAALVERRSGISLLYEARVALGLGRMRYDSAGAKAIAESYDYRYADSNGLVFASSGEVALGVRGMLSWHGHALELAAGGRARAAWIGTGDSTPDEGEAPDYDTLHLNSSLTMATYGLFARLGVVF